MKMVRQTWGGRVAEEGVAVAELRVNRTSRCHLAAAADTRRPPPTPAPSAKSCRRRCPRVRVPPARNSVGGLSGSAGMPFASAHGAIRIMANRVAGETRRSKLQRQSSLPVAAVRRWRDKRTL